MSKAVARNFAGGLRAPDAGDLRSGLEAALATLLLVQVGRLAWALAAPLPAVAPTHLPPTQTPVRPAEVAVLERIDPFFRGAEPGAGSAPGERDLRLHGVRSDARGGGSAILAGPDGRQASYLVGEEILPGVLLTRVAEDHVELRRSGRVQSLRFPAPEASPGAGP